MTTKTTTPDGLQRPGPWRRLAATPRYRITWREWRDFAAYFLCMAALFALCYVSPTPHQ